MGGIPAMAVGAILACGTIPGNVPGTMPGTMGTAPAMGAMGAAVGTEAAAIATFVIGAGGISGFTEPATLLRGSKGLKLPAPVGVRVGVVPIDVNETNSVGGKALGTSMPRKIECNKMHYNFDKLLIEHKFNFQCILFNDKFYDKFYKLSITCLFYRKVIANLNDIDNLFFYRSVIDNMSFL
ncbi:hypothetical protein FF38_07077 [Lucilia cuprina]|uniref:Uncharacterized protein n=1 Tax=Lucilia cuprina TaxID=7375 RepID=A0A0L0C8A8_LUCCU|nr:hypothetical protein FF38_07077 [Lucilia cuprina]